VHIWGNIACVALGSALGGLTRWGVGLGFQRLFGTAFPWGTFFINLSGSLFLGWFAAVLLARAAHGGEGWLSAERLRLLLGIGFTGAYTTFSTFEYEADQMLRQGESLKSLVYMAASVALGLAAVRLGTMLGRFED
jgi:CrcB protein